MTRLTGDTRQKLPSRASPRRALKPCSVSQASVMAAADGAEARRLAAAEEFDLLVSDIVLPDTTGVALAKELRAQHPGLGLMLVSGYAEESVHQQAADIRFLQKPFRLADLAQQTAAALAERPGEKA